MSDYGNPKDPQFQSAIKQIPQQFTPPRGSVLPGTPAWQSIPSAVRFAVWVWAISVIVSVAGAVIVALLFMLGVAAGS